MRSIISFDRVVALLALLVALTGGVPAYIEWRESRTFFELHSEERVQFSINNGSLIAKIALKITNADSSAVTVFGIGSYILDESGEQVSQASSSFWRPANEEDTPLPIKLDTGEGLISTLSVPFTFDDVVTANQAWTRFNPSFDASITSSQYSDALASLSGAESHKIRDQFIDAYFPGASHLAIQLRAKCDKVGMERGLLSRCVHISAGIENHQAVSVGEIAITFIPSMEKSQ